MVEKKQNKFLTVAPFECAWREELRFREAGRGCVAFEAFAHNDVTVVFREHAGSQNYHYKRDTSPNYTVILGSHRNKRLKIEVDGETAVDVDGTGLCSSSMFQSYWIGIYDGLISIGKGRYPFQNLVFQWLDSNRKVNAQYVGLSSWDKHVGYRNVSVLPLTQNHISLWKQVDCGEYDELEDDKGEEVDETMGNEEWGLENFLESGDLSDMIFVVGEEEKPVPAHKIILAASGNFQFTPTRQDTIRLHEFSYPTLHAFLKYIYTGKTQISELQLGSLRDLSLRYEVMPLVKQCEEIIERCKTNKKLFNAGKNVELSYPNFVPCCSTAFPLGLPISAKRLKQFYSDGVFSDVDVYIEGHGLIGSSHKIIISLWSIPFMKMFTNGMSESRSPEICLREVSPDAFRVMLEFMYSAELDVGEVVANGTLLLQLLLLADQFCVPLLQQECCKILLEHFSEDSLCPILQVISSVQSCKVIEESCKRRFSLNFDYCTSASMDFIFLDEGTFWSILQHPDLTVTSEERVLNAIMLWGMQANEHHGWETVDELLKQSTPETLFGLRIQYVNNLLTLVRFPLMPYLLLEKLEKTTLMKSIPTFSSLVKEAIDYLEHGVARTAADQNPRFLHRRSSYKELQYIRDGDSNGVLYFAGQSYGKHQWVNPVLSKRVSIVASSPISRFTDPKVLASRTYQGTSFAGARVEEGNKCAWWMVDIGEDHQVPPMLFLIVSLCLKFFFPKINPFAGLLRVMTFAFVFGACVQLLHP
ncbi:hypothetical protein Dimus_038613 [Dionaea muscipula]